MSKRVALVDVDGHNGFPNIPLMKIASYHKSHGDEVEWLDPIFGGHYDVCYKSKVFTFSPDYLYPLNADKVVKGGTGYDVKSVLPPLLRRLSVWITAYILMLITLSSSIREVVSAPAVSAWLSRKRDTSIPLSRWT